MPPKSRPESSSPAGASGSRTAAPGLCPLHPSVPGSPGRDRQPPRHLRRAAAQHGAGSRARLRCVPDRPVLLRGPRCCPGLPSSAAHDRRPCPFPAPHVLQASPPPPRRPRRGAHRARRHSAPATSTSANPGSCRPHVLSTEPAATPSVAPAPSRSVRQAPGLPVRRGSASLLPAGCSCPGLRPRPRSLRPLCSDAGVSRAPGPWGHLGENAALTRVWYSPQVRPQASCGPKETPGSRRCRGLCPASRPTAGRPRGCPGRPPPRPPTSGPPSWHRTQGRPGECQVGWAPAGARGPPECPLLLLTETCLPSALGTPVGRSPRRPTPQPLTCRGLTRRLLGPNRGVQRQNPPER